MTTFDLYTTCAHVYSYTTFKLYENADDYVCRQNPVSRGAWFDLDQTLFMRAEIRKFDLDTDKYGNALVCHVWVYPVKEENNG